MADKSADKKGAPATAAGSNASPETEQAAEGEEEELGEGSPGLGRNVVWGLTAGGSSMVVHLALLLMLGLMMTPAPPDEEVAVIEAAVPKEEKKPEQKPPVRLPPKITPPSTNPTNSSSASAAATRGIQGATASNFVAAPKLNATVSTRQTAFTVDVGPVSMLTTSGSQLAAAVPEGTLGDGLAAAQGYGDAMDRITQEILNMLAKRKVIVIWAMDQSESMKDDRDEINLRIEKVYAELGLSAAAKDDALLTAVTSYGAGFANHTPKATYNPQEIIAAIKAVPTDPSGEEQQCSALGNAITAFQSVAVNGNRQMAVVMVTDESGDPKTNEAQLENAIRVANDAKCKVYILGREAVFGYRHARMRYIHPETKTVHWLPIDRGPETPDEEQLQINGLRRRWDAFPSGFGPFEQSRMARQTGGIFFMLPSPEVDLVGRRADLIYDADAMRPFLPDLSARVDYIADRDKSPFRKMIAKVINDLDPYDGPYGNARSLDLSKVEVRSEDFSIDRAVFAQQANLNIQKAAQLIKYLQMAQAALESVEPMRARERSPRWRANYDLIYAQSVGFQARLQEYGWYLTEFIQTPKAITNPFGPARATNFWDTRSVARLLKPEVTQPIRDKSDALFRQIIKDYPGTPWAARADEELRRGYGIELMEDYEDPRGRGVSLPKY